MLVALAALPLVAAPAQAQSGPPTIEIVSEPRLDQLDGHGNTGTDGVNETYGRGQNIVLALTWAQDVTWDVSATNAEISLQVNVGGSNKKAVLVTDGATSGTASTLWFSYTVKMADSDANGVAVTSANNGNVVLGSNGATFKYADGTNANNSQPGLSADIGHRVDGGTADPGNTAPVFDDTDLTDPNNTPNPRTGTINLGDTRNAPTNTLVTQTVRQSWFSDSDGDPLRFTVSTSRDDLYATADYFAAIPALGVMIEDDCMLANLTPAVTSPLASDITYTAADPDGATVKATVRTITAFGCASFSSAAMSSDTTLAIAFTNTENLKEQPDASITAHLGRLTADELEVKVGGTAVALAASNALSVSGTTLTVTVAAPITGGPVTVSYTPGDDPGAVAFTDQPVELPPNTPTAAAINGNTVTVTFSSNLTAVLDNTNEEPGAVPGSALERLRWAFSVEGLFRDGVRMRSVVPTAVAVSGNTVTLTTGGVKALPGTSGYSVIYRKSTAEAVGAVLRGTDGNNVASFTRGLALTDNTTPGTARPVVTSAQVAGTELTLDFDKPLDSTSAPAGNRFRVMHAASDWHGEAVFVRGTGTASVSGSTVTVTLASKVPQDRFAVAFYSKPGSNPLREAAGTKPTVDDIEHLQATVLDRDPPLMTGGLLVGSTLTLYYGDTLDTGSAPATTAFTVTDTSNNTHTVSSVSMHANAVKLTLGTAPTSNVTVAYAVPGTNPIQDVAGNDAAALSNESVSRQSTNPTVLVFLSGVRAAGAVVSLQFSQKLDPGSVPDASAFGFTYTEYDGAQPRQKYWDITNVAVTGTDVELTVSPGWFPCVSAARVTYTKPTGTGAKPLQNLWGTAVQFSANNADVDNTRRDLCTYIVPVVAMGSSANSGDDPPQSGSGDPQGMGRRQMSLQFDRPLSTRSAPDRKSFSVTPDRGADPIEVDEARLSDDATQILLGLSRSLAGGEGVTINYRRPRGAMGLWTDDGRQIADFAGEAVVPEPNRAPTFDGAAPGTVNAPPGTLVSLPVSKDDFVDPDGDELTFTLSASRDDIYVAGGLGYSDVVDRVFFDAKTACALMALDPPLPEVYDTVVTMTATDPDGESVQVAMTLRTSRRGFVCPSLSSATVNGAELLMTFDTAFERRHRWLPTASDFEVSVDGGVVDLAADAVSVSGDTISLTLAEPVTASESVTVSYSSVDTPIAVAFADEPAANHSPAPLNQAPVFGGRAPGWVNAPPGVLVSLPVSKADFSDPDVDPLTFTLSTSRDDTYVAGDLVYSDVVDRVFFVAKTACAFAGANPPLRGVVDTVVTMTATDPDGEAAQVAMTFRTDPESYPCPSLSSAAVEGASLTIELDADMAPSYRRLPTANEFEVTVDGVTASLAADGLSASGNTLTLTLAEPVTANQSVTVSYTPGDFPVAAAFTDASATNDTPPVEAPAGEEDESAAGDAVLAGLTVNGNELILTFHQDLTAMDDAAARALRFAFLVQGAYRHGVLISNQSPNQVVIDGATVTLTLGVGIPAGHEVTVSYSAAAAGNSLRYADGTAIADFDSTLTTTQQG